MVFKINSELLNSVSDDEFLNQIPEGNILRNVEPIRYQRQSKMISQIIAYIWRHLNQDDEHLQTARELDKYFKNTRIRDREYKLKDLLFARPNSSNSDENARFELLKEVFGENLSQEPIFDALDRDLIMFEVDLSEFRTQLEDPRPGEEKWTAVVGYPPRPFISDYGQLTNQELEDWVNNTEDNKFVADNPFIPLCCS